MCSPEVMARVRSAITRRGFLKGVGAAAAAGAVGLAPARSAAALRRGGARLDDLTDVVSPAFPVFPAFAPMEITPVATIAQQGFYANRLTFNTKHTGTHIDAPAISPRASPRPNGCPPTSSSPRSW